MDFYPEILKFADGSDVTRESFPLRRQEMIKILAENAYGNFPRAPEKVTGIKEYPRDCRACSGHMKAADVLISFDTPKGGFSFPVKYFEPTDGAKRPLIVLINFSPDRYDKYCSPEEITDSGFALASFCYEDITKDNGDFSDGLAGMFDRPSDGTGYGKITLWAYALSRTVDYFSTLSDIDAENIAVIGHSRLGKTALWCAANDVRVKYVCSNDSGCMGAAYNRTRHRGGETLEIITDNFPYWFCENLLNYRNKTESLPFDQHMLIGACAPRYVCVNSAWEDAWADQYSEQLSCIGASAAWEVLGKDGFVGKKTAAENNDVFNGGDIAYHMRDGIHFLGRADWNNFIKFIKSKDKKMRTDDFDKNLAVNTDINEHGIVWLDAKNEPFLLSGVHYDKKRNAYYRMPQDIAEKVNSGVEWLNSNTAGGRLRFSTDSDYIAIRAVMRNIPPMPHMPLSGQSGFDIYIKNGSSSVYLNTFMPPMGMNEGYSSGLRLDGKMHEYIINFPLYDRVDELYVALKKDSALFPGSDYKYKTPVVYYGSSITQGGCASRPGNSYQAMISRALDTEFINLGFSGSCKAEDIMSEYLSTLDMSVFVYDYDHNAPSPEYLRETHKRLFDKIRSARTELPVIIVSAPDIMLRGGVFTERRAIVKATYDAAKAAGDRNVYFVDGNSLFAEDMFDSCTVDGCHPNDLGFYRMARKIGEAVKTVLEK